MAPSMTSLFTVLVALLPVSSASSSHSHLHVKHNLLHKRGVNVPAGLPTPWTYKGCYSDSVGSRALGGANYQSGNAMTASAFNYRHLYYFWVVAKEGGIARAAERLGMAIQTVSAQVRELERALGHVLLKPAGRGLALTEAGIAAMQQADLIFQLGEELPALVRDAASVPALRLNAGISDGLPKLVVRRLLQPVMLEPNLRLHCSEGRFDDLLAALALHRLDVVLARIFHRSKSAAPP